MKKSILKLSPLLDKETEKTKKLENSLPKKTEKEKKKKGNNKKTVSFLLNKDEREKMDILFERILKVTEETVSQIPNNSQISPILFALGRKDAEDGKYFVFINEIEGSNAEQRAAFCNSLGSALASDGFNAIAFYASVEAWMVCQDAKESPVLPSSSPNRESVLVLAAMSIDGAWRTVLKKLVDGEKRKLVDYATPDGKKVFSDKTWKKNDGKTGLSAIILEEAWAGYNSSRVGTMLNELFH